jgi:EAL domain-containing protein (putative c-di-GMP-specific phosphodiesterase class I)
MGKQTIAESVETVATLEALRSVGVDFAQGNAIAPPALFAPAGSRKRSAGHERSDAERNGEPLRRPAAAVLTSRISHDKSVR